MITDGTETIVTLVNSTVHLGSADMRKILMAILMNGGKTLVEAWNTSIEIEDMADKWFS